jgi:nitrate reductase NapAB chaperone NapD
MTSADQWSVSGLSVTVRPDRLAEVEQSIDERRGFEVHARDPQTGKLIVVQERGSVDEHRRGLRELQALPGVLTAELVLHYQEPAGQCDENTTGGRS